MSWYEDKESSDKGLLNNSVFQNILKFLIAEAAMFCQISHDWKLEGYSRSATTPDLCPVCQSYKKANSVT